MSLPCPYGDYLTPTDTPNEEAADLFEHLAGVHLVDHAELFDDLAERMRTIRLPAG